MRILGSTLIVLLLIGGVALMAYARWTGALTAADAALEDGHLQQAVASYQTAEERFDAVPAIKQFAGAEYARAVGNHFLALYRLGRYDEVVDLAQKAPPESSPHFWAGCALFQKAAVEEKPDARLSWFSRAEDELHKAVETTPDDWDAKYDFELTAKLASELRKQPNTPPKQLMQLLRPPTAGQKNPRKVG